MIAKYAIRRIYRAGAMRWNGLSRLRLMAPTRILISHHHPSVRRGLRTILEAAKQYEICGEAGDGSQTLELATRLTPDILIMEISMPPPNGLDVAAKLRQSASKTKILFVTMHDSKEMKMGAMFWNFYGVNSPEF